MHWDPEAEKAAARRMWWLPIYVVAATVLTFSLLGIFLVDRLISVEESIGYQQPVAANAAAVTRTQIGIAMGGDIPWTERLPGRYLDCTTWDGKTGRQWIGTVAVTGPMTAGQRRTTGRLLFTALAENGFTGPAKPLPFGEHTWQFTYNNTYDSGVRVVTSDTETTAVAFTGCYRT